MICINCRKETDNLMNVYTSIEDYHIKKMSLCDNKQPLCDDCLKN